jgi:hypothetical protein
MIPPRVKPPERRGSDPISASVLGHQPEALLAFMKLYGRLWSHGILDQSSVRALRMRAISLLD